jgi:sec-independent protein translocase protein TatA
MLEDLSFGKILLILLVIVILFGAKKIPDLAQGLGKGIREFKKAINDDENDNNKSGTSDKKEDTK